MQEQSKSIIRLDLGCGRNKVKDEANPWTGVDARAFEGVDWVCDLRQKHWRIPGDHETSSLPRRLIHENEDGQLKLYDTLPDDSVDEVHCSHFLEHLTGAERIHFFNELYRVLKPGAQARIITPHWSHERAYGDPTHQWPPVCSWTYFYLQKAWRDVNAPHADYLCDFDYVLAGTHDPNDPYVAFRTTEVKMSLMAHQVNVTTDLIATLTKRVPV